MSPITRRTALKSALATAGGFLGACGGGGSADELDVAGAGAPAVTGLALSGPSSGVAGAASTQFVVSLAPAFGSLEGRVVVTPSDQGAGGVFTPTSLTLDNTTRSASFTYTPRAAGALSISVTNDRSLIAPAAVAYAAARAVTPLLSLGFDAATPEQISLHCPTLRTVAEGTTATVRFKAVTSASWRSAHPLLHVVPAYVTGGGPAAPVESFAGAIFDLRPGTTYDIELTVTEPGETPVVLTGTRATRALAGPAGKPTKTASPGANLQTVFDQLVPGDVLELQNGTYTVSNSNGLRPNVAGTAAKPIYIRGASRDGVVIHAPSSVALQLGATSYLVIENLTIRGSGVDGGGNAGSIGLLFNDGSGVQTEVTVRDVSFVGVDKGIKAYARVDGCMVYHCELRGNNSWDMAYTIQPDSGAANLTWNDDGISLPGQGNAAWNNTLSGFGDAFSVYQGVMSAAVYFWRNRVEMTGDDAFEADEGTRNLGFYDNYIANSGTFLSLDPLYGGPLYCFRNISINTIRSPFKWNSPNSGQLIYNNTLLRTDGTNGAGWSQANNGAQRNWSYRNNLFVYRGGSANTFHFNTSADQLDFTHNAWYPDRAFNWPPAGGGFSSVAAAAAGLPSRQTVFGSLQRHAQDIAVASNPWSETIQLGADHTTAYAAQQVPVLASGSPARASGVAIAGITDGHSGSAPDRGAIITGRAVPQYGALRPPAWAAQTASGTWAEVPMAATLSAVDPIKSPLYNPRYPDTPEWAENNLRQSAVVTAWCGAAYDEATDSMWLGLGGGHRDYAGNEVYRCRFFDDRPAWEMVRPPSGAVGNLLPTKDSAEATGLHADGRPRATHGYNKWVYVPGVGPVLAAHGNTSWAGSGGRRWAVFLDEHNGEASFSAEPTMFPLNTTEGLGASHDPTRNAIWIVPGNTMPVVRYDIPEGRGAHTGSHTAVGPAVPRYGSASACYLLGHDCLLIGSSDFDETVGQWLVFDCATGSYHSPSFEGSGFIGHSQGSGQPRWVPALGAACVWNNQGDTTRITMLTPGANPRTDRWTVSALPVASSNTVVPSARAPTGTYGRFVYSPRLGGFLVFNSTAGPTYFYKL